MIGLAESGSRLQHPAQIAWPGGAHDIDFHRGACRRASAAPKAKSRNLSLDRARTFLTLVVLLHHAVIPYTYYGHTDPKEFFGFDMIVLATDSFFMAMFFFLSGLFVWPGIARKGPLNYLADRLLRLGLPFVICALHGHSARLLRHLAAAPSRDRLFGILVEHDHEGPVAERTDLVPLGLARLRRGCLPAVSAVAQPARSDQSPLAARPPPARRVLRGHACRHRGVLRSRADALTEPSSWFEFGPFSVQHGRVMLYATYFFFGAGIGVAQYGSRVARGRRPDGEGQLGLDDAGDRSVLPDVGADLHQARKSGQSVAVAELV